MKNNKDFTIDEAKKKCLVKVIGKENYEEIINNYEPETTIEDNYLNNNAPVAKPENVGFDLGNYISLDQPVCREERQFALYFFNKLQYLEKDSAIRVQLENNPSDKPFLAEDDKIIEVFYEVAIMRDYWHVHKEYFNKLLFEYVTSPENNLLKTSCLEEAKKNENNIFGENNITHANGWNPPIYIARWMMNAKPDIGLIIENNGNYKFSFIECKYQSKQDKYTHYDIANYMEQTTLQEHILNFICGKLKANYNSSPLTKGQVGLVRFTKEDIINVKSIKNEDSEEEIEILLRHILP